MEEHAHLERPGPACDGGADASQADDPQRRARHLAAEKRALRPGRAPAAGAHEHVSFHDPATDGEHQRDREIGRRGVEHPRRVRDRDAARPARVDVDAVVADAVVRDEPQRRQPFEDGCVDDVAGDDQRLDVVVRLLE